MYREPIQADELDGIPIWGLVLLAVKHSRLVQHLTIGRNMAKGLSDALELSEEVAENASARTSENRNRLRHLANDSQEFACGASGISDDEEIAQACERGDPEALGLVREGDYAGAAGWSVYCTATSAWECIDFGIEDDEAILSQNGFISGTVKSVQKFSSEAINASIRAGKLSGGSIEELTIAARLDIDHLKRLSKTQDWDNSAAISSRVLDFNSCFLSYCTKDESLATRLFKDLILAGVQCWKWDHNSQIGEDIWEQVERAIQEHDRTVLIISRDSLGSPYVLREIEMTLGGVKEDGSKKSETVLLPLRTDNYVIEEWEHQAKEKLLEREMADARNWSEDEAVYEKVLKQITHALRRV